MKTWKEPKLDNLVFSRTAGNPDKCTNNNGNAERCRYGYDNAMFNCPHYGKQGHTCDYLSSVGS